MNETNNENLIAALWSMWGAICQAHKVEIYNEHINALYEIAYEAMKLCGQIQDKQDDI